MRSKRMLTGAAVIGCLAAAMTSGAYAQEANTTDQLNARTGQHPAASARTNSSIRQGQSVDTNAQLNARTNSPGMSTNAQAERRGLANEGRMRASAREGQFERRGLAHENRMGASVREGRGYAEQRALRGEHTAYARVSEPRYGRSWRGERGLYARAGVEGGYRGGRYAYRDRAVGAGVGVAAADYGYRHRPLYAYAPAYQAGVAPAPRYSYRPAYYGRGYNVAMNTGPYYTPGWDTAYAGPYNTAFAGPYYDYAPGVSFGIGIGPVGIGFGPAWGW